MFFRQIEKLALQLGGQRASTFAMCVVTAIVLASGIMKHRKQSDDFNNRTGAGSEQHSVSFHTPPVLRAVDGITVTDKLSDNLLPKALVIILHEQLLGPDSYAA